MRRIRLARFLERIADLLPRQYPVKGHLDKQPIFVFGSGRNGSTLLSLMLNQNSELFFPSEQYFLGHSIIKFKLYNFLIWRDLMKIIAGELIPAAGSHTWKYVPDDVISALFHMKNRSLQHVVDCIYRSYASSLGMDKTYWGDTSATNMEYVPEIFSAFPDARYLFLVRDGRDVVSGFKKGGHVFGALSDPLCAAMHWNKSIAAYDWLSRKTNVLMVRYERLVRDPEAELKAICSFLRVQYEPRMVNYQSFIPELAIYQESVHVNLANPISDHAVGQWKKILTNEEIDLVLPRLEKNLRRFGY